MGYRLDEVAKHLALGRNVYLEANGASRLLVYLPDYENCCRHRWGPDY